MGLAASQGRYLCLTARMSDLVYEGQQISQQRLALARETQTVAEDYTKALSNTKMEYRLQDGTRQQLNYDVITDPNPDTGLCMRIVDVNGNIVVPSQSSSINASYKDADGNDVNEVFSSAEEFVNKVLKNDASISDNDIAKYSKMSLNELVQKFKNENITISFNEDKYSYLKSESNQHYLFDENCKNPEYLQQMLTSGEWLLQQATPLKDEGWDNFLWQGSTAISEVNDTSDDAAAEAKYEAATIELQRKDKMLELRLEQVQTEENAVEKELDSVKEIIDKNVESSFKTFA